MDRREAVDAMNLVAATHGGRVDVDPAADPGSMDPPALVDRKAPLCDPDA
jgi:hypothetical protein